MKDFFEIIKEAKIYNEMNHNKSENIYTFNNGSEVCFFSAIDDQRIRGRKSDIVFMNEANELSFDIFNQLVLRCSGAILIDFNPSEQENWIYNLLEQQPEKAILIKSTYKDNYFLPKEQVEYIENLINVDQNYYRVYALGEKPISESRIYTHFRKYIDQPTSVSNYSFGLDFGFNHPTSLVKVLTSNGKYYIDELVYESKLTVEDLINKMNNLLTDSDRFKPIYCDGSRPEAIEALKRAGFNAKPANKNVKAGIDFIKSKEVFIHADATNLWKEVNLYSWKTVNNQITDEPVKLNDDGMDSLRYGIYSGVKAKTGFNTTWQFI